MSIQQLLMSLEMVTLMILKLLMSFTIIVNVIKKGDLMTLITLLIT